LYKIVTDITTRKDTWKYNTKKNYKEIFNLEHYA
jgi:hypothetical protein